MGARRFGRGRQIMQQPKKIAPGVLDTTCRQLKQELGCSDERAFEILYGWAETCKNAQAFGLTHIVTRVATLAVLCKNLKKC
jgi:hypothetical protein